MIANLFSCLFITALNDPTKQMGIVEASSYHVILASRGMGPSQKTVEATECKHQDHSDHQTLHITLQGPGGTTEPLIRCFSSLEW